MYFSSISFSTTSLLKLDLNFEDSLKISLSLLGLEVVIIGRQDPLNFFNLFTGSFWY